MDGVIENDDATNQHAAKLRVFLSYSRKDSEFVTRLSDALTGRGYLADFDRSTHDKDNVTTGISAEDEWWKRLQEMIEAADVMVFVVSPDSASSNVCDEEIAYARSRGKRVLPVLRREIDFASAPPRLAALNVKIRMVESDPAAFDAGVCALSAALDRDVAWLREQTRLVLATANWERSGKGEDELLHGAEISEAEAWSARRPTSAPEAPESVLAFLAESRRMQTMREAAAQRRTRIMRWLTALGLAATAAAFIATVIGAWSVMQGMRQLARRESSMLAIEASEAFDSGQHDLAIRLAMIAVRDTWLSPAAGESNFELGRAAAASRLMMRFTKVDGSGCIDVNADGSEVLATEEQDYIEPRPARTRLMSRAANGVWSDIELPQADAGAHCARFAPQGDAVIISRQDGQIGVLDRATGKYELLEVSGIFFGAAKMLRDGRVVAGASRTAAVWTKTAAGWKAEILAPTADADPNLSWESNLDTRVSDDGATIVRRMPRGVHIWSRLDDGSWTVRSILNFSARKGVNGTAAVVPADSRTADQTMDDDASSYLISMELSRDGRRMLLIDGEMAETWEQASAGSWRLIDQLAPDEGDLFGEGALSPDGRNMLMIQTDGMWLQSTMESGKFGIEDVGKPYTAYASPVFTPDGSRFAVQSSDFLIWNVDDAGGAPLTIATHGAYGAFSGDGTVLVTGGSSALRPGIEIWKLSGNELAAGVLLDADGDSTDGSGFLQDGRIFQATGDTMRIWRKGPDGGWRIDASVDQAKYVRFAHAGGAAIVEPSSAGALIMEEGVAGGWSTAAIATKKNPRWGAISPDGGTLLFDDGERKASVWTRQTQGFSREAIGGDKEPIEAAAVSLGGASIASLSPRIEPNGRSSARRMVSLWTRSNENAWTSQLISEHADFGAKSIAISRDGRRVAATGGDSIWVWTQDRRGVWSEEQIEFGADVVRISPDGPTLATAKPETGARIWKRREDGKWIDAEIGRMNESVDDIEFSPDGRSLLATGLSGGMRVLDVGWLGVGGDDGRYNGQRMTAEVCASKLPLSPDRNLRRITAQDISSAPVLRGREGEDVCSWRPSWYDDLLEALFGWTG